MLTRFEGSDYDDACSSTTTNSLVIKIPLIIYLHMLTPSNLQHYTANDI